LAERTDPTLRLEVGGGVENEELRVKNEEGKGSG
jgi:hypothetical protein